MTHAIDVVRYTSAQVAALDKLCRETFLAQHEWCERCGQAVHLEWAHIRRRGNGQLATRWDLDNALALCRDCHTYLDDSTERMESFVDAQRGQGAYQDLRERSNLSATRSAAEIRATLRAAA